jgi:hypothetical protein
MAVGRIYDSEELGRLEATLKEQQSEMDKIDNEESVKKVDVIRYSILLVGIVSTLFFFKYLVDKKK